MNTLNQTRLWAAVLSCVLALDLHAQILQPAPRPASNPPGTVAPPNPPNPPSQSPPADSPTAQPDPSAQQNDRAGPDSQLNPLDRQGIRRPESLDPPGTLQPGEEPSEFDARSNLGTARQAVNSRQNFARADSDQDGVVSREELRKFADASASGMSFEELDQNSDGSVSLNEWANYRDIDGDDPTDPE